VWPKVSDQLILLDFVDRKDHKLVYMFYIFLLFLIRAKILEIVNLIQSSAGGKYVIGQRTFRLSMFMILS
jgi:hypothetical protein